MIGSLIFSNVSSVNLGNKIILIYVTLLADSLSVGTFLRQLNRVGGV